MRFLKEHAHILRRTGVVALILLAIGTINDQFISSSMQDSMMSDSGPGLLLVLYGFTSVANSLVFPTLASLCLYFGIAKFRGSQEKTIDFLTRVPQQTFIETLRGWGSCMAWGLFLLLPGLFRLFQLVFIPLIVVFSKSYQNGQSDALRLSTQYFRKHPFLVFGFVLSFSLIIPLVSTSLTDPYRNFASSPLSAFLCTLLDLVLLTISVQILFRLFERNRQELGDESLFSMEGHSTTSSRADI